MKKVWMTMLVLFVFVGFTAAVAAAAGPGSPPPDGAVPPAGYGEPPGKEAPGGFHGGFGPRFGGVNFPQHLDLSKEQRDRLQESRDRFFRETRDLRYDMAMRELEMRKLFADPGTTEAALLAKQKELSALHQKLADRMAKRMIKDRSILTPEQIAKLDPLPFGPGPEGCRGGGEMMGPRPRR